MKVFHRFLFDIQKSFFTVKLIIMLNSHSSMGKLSHPFKIGKFPARPPRSRLLCSSQGFSVTASSSHPLLQRFLCRPQFCGCNSCFEKHNKNCQLRRLVNTAFTHAKKLCPCKVRKKISNKTNFSMELQPRHCI